MSMRVPGLMSRTLLDGVDQLPDLRPARRCVMAAVEARFALPCRKAEAIAAARPVRGLPLGRRAAA